MNSAEIEYVYVLNSGAPNDLNCGIHFRLDNGLVGVVTQEEWEFLCLTKSKTCPKCNKTFYSARTMRRHLTSVHVETKDIQCDECDKMFSTKNGLHVHKKSIHRGERPLLTPLECDYCGMIKKNKTNLRDHICAHMGLKMHQCRYCEMSFTSKKGLKRHSEKHEKRTYHPPRPIEDYQIEGISADQYKKLVKNKVKNCPNCDKLYTTPRNMRKHLRDVHAEQRNCVCDQCGNQYKSKSSLREHKKHMHSTDKKPQGKKEKKFECHICGVMQATKYTLRDHINTHTGTKYECDICGNGYASVKHLKRHKVRHLQEAGQLPASMTHRCELCEKVFTQAHRLKKHLEWVHGDKHHLCKICGAEIKGSLEQHMITHTGEKKYCCHICGKKLRGKLKEHMLTHTGERPYACEFCGSTFKDKWYLRIHVRKHSGERPYMCNHCGQSFAARSAFTLHLKKHSNLSQSVQCEYCRLSFPTKLKLKDHLKTHFS
uniref:Zinc finger protein 878 n=2 Tax=Cacopsylla melanoneura TaxID=428564 RepID=A0A8D8SFE5_9HEMI